MRFVFVGTALNAQRGGLEVGDASLRNSDPMPLRPQESVKYHEISRVRLKQDIPTMLDQNQTDPAYRLGRLFSAMEKTLVADLYGSSVLAEVGAFGGARIETV
jgi:hypothetical protein